MLKSLQFEATFASTNRTIKGDHAFEAGMTAISGANETGKSMRLEMIRYALFGTPALRSALSSYTTLWVRLKFALGGHGYEVYRNGSHVKLKKNDLDFAAGAKPVNEAIVKLFGYDMQVFDSANACLQGEVEALTNKTPAERKRMVDRTIGLHAIDDLQKEYAAEISSINKTIAALKAAQGPEPVKPECYDGYNKSSGKLRELEQMQIRQGQLIAKAAELRGMKCEPPLDFVPTIFQTMGELREIEQRIINRNTQISMLEDQLKRLPAAVDVEKNKETINKLQSYLDRGMVDKWEAYEGYLALKKEKEGLLVGLSKEQLLDIKTAFEMKELYDKLDDLIKAGHSVDCPHCKTNFNLNHSDLTTIRSQIPEEWGIGRVMSFIDLASEKGIKARKVDGLIEAITEWEAFSQLPIVDKPDEPNLGSHASVVLQIKQAEIALKNHEVVTQLKDQLEPLKLAGMQDVALSDVRSDIKQRAVEDGQRDSNVIQQAQYNLYLRRAELYAPALADKEFVDQRVLDLMNEISKAKDYEAQLEAYTIRSENYYKMNLEIESHQTRLDQFTNVRKALSDIKPKVKTYLLPSLSRVASTFLAEMTNSQRNRIDINEEFEISVDGQPVETLSGSGKAVANLAVRLGLGTVLTNKVFSVLLADEVDASMDDERSRHTAGCLRNLTKVFSQIILVSHHKAEADHHITL